jgi:hypothetical protein
LLRKADYVATIWQVTWAWDGFTGAPGYTNLYYQAQTQDGTECAAAVAKSRTLWTALAGLVPNLVHLDLVTDVRLIDDTDGTLRNIFTVSGTAGVAGSGGVGSYTGPSGGCIDWLTGVTHGRHMLTGRTFVVPLIGTAYESNGTLSSATVTGLANAAESMRTGVGPTFGVWGRPRKAPEPPATKPPQLIGAWHPAISSRVVDRAAVLRSRRQ